MSELRGFLGTVNFLRKFCPGVSKLAVPLSALSSEKVPFVWTSECNDAFLEVKNLFVNPPLLVHANPEKQYILERDASQFAIGSVLLQVADDGREHPVAYFSRKLNPQQINYPVYDKELYAIVASLEHWRHHL